MKHSNNWKQKLLYEIEWNDGCKLHELRIWNASHTVSLVCNGKKVCEGNMKNDAIHLTNLKTKSKLDGKIIWDDWFCNGPYIEWSDNTKWHAKNWSQIKKSKFFDTMLIALGAVVAGGATFATVRKAKQGLRRFQRATPVAPSQAPVNFADPALPPATADAKLLKDFQEALKVYPQNPPSDFDP